MSKLDIFIPCYNAEKYIGKTLESIQTQTYTDFNVIIIDDGSTDRSAEIIQRYIKADPRIKMIHNEGNKGVQYTRNRGWKECQGEYIALMDADDEMPQYRLEHQMKYLLEHPECDVLTGGMQLMSEAGVKGEKKLFGECNTKEVAAAFFFRNIIVNGSAIVKKEFLNEHKIFYDETFLSVGDYNFWVDCILAGANLHVMNEILEYYRIVDSGVSKTNSRPDKLEQRKASFDFIHQKILDFYSIHLNDEEKKIYFEYTNEVSKTTVQKIKDFPKFMRMLRKLEKQNPFETDEFLIECRKFRKRFYRF